MIYSIWEHGDSTGMVGGVDVPRFANGQPIEEINILRAIIDVETWEEAMVLYDIILSGNPFMWQ